MAARIYKNDDEDAVSIIHENQRIDFSIIKEDGIMIIGLFEDGKGDPVQEITLPLLPGLGALGPFFSDAQVLLDMIGMKPAAERQEA